MRRRYWESAPPAEDVLHQVFLKLLGGRSSFRSDVRPYLFRAVRNAALNSRRSRKRDVPLDDQQWLAQPAEAVETGWRWKKRYWNFPANSVK